LGKDRIAILSPLTAANALVRRRRWTGTFAHGGRRTMCNVFIRRYVIRAGTCPPPKKSPLVGAFGPADTRYLWPFSSNGILIGLAVVAQFTAVPHKRATSVTITTFSDLIYETSRCVLSECSHMESTLVGITGNAASDETVPERQHLSAAVEVKEDISAQRRKTGCVECLRTSGHGFHLHDVLQYAENTN